MQNRDNIGKEEAFVITKNDISKTKHSTRNYMILILEKTLAVFDTIINTDNLNAEQVIEIAKSTVRELL